VLAETSDEPETVSPIAQSKGEDFNLLSIKTFSPAPISFQTIAVVDVDRLLLAYPLSSDSKEARVRLLADIQHAIAVCASAHNFTLVLDRGGQSLTQLPVVLSAADPFDVTDEVAQQLAYVRPADPSR
jgi:Skp family chaperone for outer membrane proteins